MMVTKIDLKNDDKEALKNGVMGLVLAIVEVIRDALHLQAMRRVESGSLTQEEIERLGRALEEFDQAIEKIKEEHGIKESIQSIRGDLDNMANDLVNSFIQEENLRKLEAQK